MSDARCMRRNRINKKFHHRTSGGRKARSTKHHPGFDHRRGSLEGGQRGKYMAQHKQGDSPVVIPLPVLCST